MGQVWGVAAGLALRVVMSKRDKNPLDMSEADDSMLSAGDGLSADALQPHADSAAKSEQSRHFNTWLDRTLPLLQDRLAAFLPADITALKDKAKH